MKLVVLSVMSLVSLSFCSTKKTSVLIITNKQKAPIDSIRIASYGMNEKFVDLKFNEQQQRVVAITPPGNSEGALTITIFKAGSIVQTGSFGYYLSPNDIKDKYFVSIMEEDVIKEE